MTVKIEGLDEFKINLDLFMIESVDEIARAIYDGNVMIQNEAKQNHPYIDRTQNLTNSIQTEAPEITNEKITCETMAGMWYGIYVELGTSRNRPYPYLFPALEKMSIPATLHILEVMKKIRWIE